MSAPLITVGIWDTVILQRPTPIVSSDNLGNATRGGPIHEWITYPPAIL